MSTGSHRRYHALDGLRATMMLLGLVLHSAISYGEFPYGAAWPYKDASTHPVFDQVVIFIHVFRMPIFYLMAGFFAALLYVRRGAVGLARNRATRILVPFVTGWVVLFPLVMGGFAFANAAQAGALSFGLETVTSRAASGGLFYGNSTLHLWFLYDLLFLYIAVLILAPLILRVPESWRSRMLTTFGSLARHRLRPVFFAVPTALTLYLIPSGTLRTSTSFVPDPNVLLAYGVFFGFGWLLYLRRDLLPTFDRFAWTQVIFGGALLPVNLLALRTVIASMPEPEPMARLLTLSTGALTVWLFVFGITGLFLRYLDRPSARVRYIVDASYWLYLIHLPFTIWIPGLISGFGWAAVVKFLVVMAIATPIWFASYDLLVRTTIIGKVLNGRRYPRGLPRIEMHQAERRCLSRSDQEFASSDPA